MEIFKNDDYDNKMISARYVNRFISLDSLEEFGKYDLFPNVKEVTESFGMYSAVTHNICMNDEYIDVDRENTRIFVVGDGVVPRTASVFAFMTKWECYSIDPDMRDVDYSGIRRLKTFPHKIEDTSRSSYIERIIRYEDQGWNAKNHIIIMPHSHAEIEPTWERLHNDRTWLITMPCCVHHEMKKLECYSYTDPHIASEKNRIKIYCNYKKLNYE